MEHCNELRYYTGSFATCEYYVAAYSDEDADKICKRFSELENIALTHVPEGWGNLFGYEQPVCTDPAFIKAERMGNKTHIIKWVYYAKA